MAVKKIYFHVFVLNKEFHYNAISGGINAINIWTKHLDPDKYKCFIRNNLELNIKEILASDLVIICNCRGYFSGIRQLCDTLEKPYATIPFFEDQNLYWSTCKHFNITIANLLNSKNPRRQIENLDINSIAKSSLKTISNDLTNKSVFEKALFNLTNSRSESKNLRKLAPSSPIERIQLSCGIVQKDHFKENCEFLQKTGLKKGEYILQIGAVCRRKNQLTSVLATRNNKAPLVFYSLIIYK